MGRKSNAAKSLETELKAQPRKPRKKREPREIPLGFQAGQLVLISAPRDLKGKKFGIVFEGCKHCGGISVRLSDDGSIAKYFCVRPELGDTIVRLHNSDDGNEAKTV